MTAFQATDIPSSVTNLEGLVIWACAALAELNEGSSVVVSRNSTQPVVGLYTYPFPDDEVSNHRVVISCYLPLNSTWRSADRLWGTGVAEASIDAIPTAYLN